MEQQPPSPYGVDQWIAFLRDKPLPVHARTTLLLRNLLSDPELSLNQLQPIIAADPVYSAHVVSRANQLSRNPETSASTTDLAVATLGLDHLRALSRSLPVMTPNHHSVPHKQYFHAIADSYHAAVQAANLCRFSDPAVINATRTAALFYGIGHWALWRHAPHQISEIKIRIYEQGADTALAEYDVLGCTIQAISQGLVEAWQLSQLAVEALRHTTSPDAALLDKLHRYALHRDRLSADEERAAKQLLNATFYPVKLGNWLALATSYGWGKPKTRRLLELATDYLQLPADEVSQRLHQNCVSASRQYHVPGIMAPAAQLLLLPSAQVLSYRLDAPSGAATPPPQPAAVPASAVPPSPAASGDPRMADEALYQQVLTRLHAAPRQPLGAEPILSELLRGLRRGLGLERVALFRVEADELLPCKQAGFARGTALPQFTQSLKLPSLFKQLAQRPLAVWVTERNREQIWAELPERFKAICHQHSFALTSLFVGRQVGYYLYADRDDERRVLSEFDNRHFKQLAIAASRCLNATPRQAD